jgi:hypothetical protein
VSLQFAFHSYGVIACTHPRQRKASAVATTCQQASVHWAKSHFKIRKDSFQHWANGYNSSSSNSLAPVKDVPQFNRAIT